MSFELLFFSIFVGGWLFGRVFEFIRLPAVLGMTFFGILLSAIPTNQIWPAGFLDLAPFIKSLALVIILLRAGLGISKTELKDAGITAILMASLPCLLEGLALMGLFIALFEFPWEVAGLTAFMLSAVSPAVVIPSMLNLKAKGLGIRHGVITTVLAGASADDVLAITLFTLFLSFAKTGEGLSTIQELARLPITLIGGVLIGLALGYLFAWWFKRHHKTIRATEKVLLLLGSSVFLLEIGNAFHVAALLGVMGAGFIILEKAEREAHEMAKKLEKIWVFAQIALFVLIGMSLEIDTALEAGPLALLVIFLGLIARSIGVLLATAPSKMNFKERIFCVVAYLPKATVQAALGGVALSASLPEGEIILAIAVLSILFTAPLGLIGIRLSAKRLL